MRFHSRLSLLASPALLLALAACSGDDTGGGAGGSSSTSTSTDTHNSTTGTSTFTNTGTGGASVGHVVFVQGGEVHRVVAAPGATPDNISAALDSMSPGGEDTLAATAPDGEHIVFRTTRLGCDYDCLGLVTADLQTFELVSAGGDYLRPRGRAAVASGGALIVYPEVGESHAVELFAVRREGSTWSTPVAITAGSSRAYNHSPAISDDGTHVLFDCSDADEYGGEGTEICEVGVDGSGFHVRVRLNDGPSGVTAKALHHPDYAPDGSVVFEGDWGGEKIWRSPAGGGASTVVGDFGDDNSPCVLPDGRVVSLWLGREGNSASGHEIKAMSASGESYEMLVTDVDVEDIGLTCSR